MAGWQLTRQQLISAFAEIGAGDDWDFVPAVPINLAAFLEYRIKPRFVEWHCCLCMVKQLRKLAALEFKHLFGRPVLTFHQHFVNALPK